jgi:hypothetical protein
MSNAILDWLEKRRVHRELQARWDVLENQAHAGMVFYELSEGHREAVTEKLKTDIEQLRDDFATANIEPPDDLVEFSNYCGTRNRAAEPIGRSSRNVVLAAHFLCGGGSSIAAAHATF